MEHKTRTKALSWLLSLAMLFSLVPGMSLTAMADSEVSYQEGSWSGNSVAYATKTAANPTTLASDTTAWGDGNWYVVPANGVTISDRISVTGTVNLILTDGNTLTASKGITVTDGNTLNIYAQSVGDTAGSLLIDGVENYNAGIGGEFGKNAGTVNIHGGKINTKGGGNGAGIGGGYNGNGGNITIYGGTIDATGSVYGAGIGGGQPGETGGNGGTVTIYGGTVTAKGSTGGGAGIGGGYTGGNGGNVTINGGTVIATGGPIDEFGCGSMGIGGVCGRERKQEMLDSDHPESNFTITPPENGSLTVNNGLKVYGGNSADPTTEITSEQFNEIYAENYNKTDVYRYMIVSAPPHTHSFTYAADGATITATCSNTDGCTLPESKATLTIAPSSSGGYGASLSGDTTAFGVTDADIEYSSNGTNWDKTVPTTTGSYQARITVTDATDNTKTYTATVSYGVHTITTDKTYTADNDHGTVSVSAVAAAANTTVTITTTPAPVFQLESLTVTKAGGGTVAVTINGNNGTFTMPAEAVTVSATFVGKDITVNLNNVTGGGSTCTAKLLDSSYNETSSLTKKAGKEFILSINKDEAHSYKVSFSSGSPVSMRGFSVDEYEAYINSTKSESLNTYLYRVTMPGVDSGSVNMTVTFAEAKTFTILYQPTTNANEVWVKFGYEDGQDKLVTAKMSKDAAMGDVAVWSLKMSAAFDPTKIAFATSKSVAESANTEAAAVSETSSWSNITGGQYLIVGGDAKTVIATFTADSTPANANRDATVISIGDNATYQIAICASGGNGSVTTPAAPTRPGYDFVAWRGYEGITAKEYPANTEISVKENMAFSAV